MISHRLNTHTVVVNCGGRTRSIIGAQALINAQIPNKVVSLKNGTQDWHLYGYEVIKGATCVAPEVSSEGLKRAHEGAANVAELCDVRALRKDEFLQWRHESSHRTTYFLMSEPTTSMSRVMYLVRNTSLAGSSFKKQTVILRFGELAWCSLITMAYVQR